MNILSDPSYKIIMYSLMTFLLISLLSLRARNAKQAAQSKTLTLISNKLTPYIRRIVFAAAVAFACLLYYVVAYNVSTSSAALSALMRYYGLTALFGLFITLTPGLLMVFFPRFQLNGLLYVARRALGVSSFFFALLHATIGFFNNLSGSLQSIFLLSQNNQLAIIFSTIALLILSLMALTSFDKAVVWMTYKKWKLLHRVIYLATALIILHSFLIGSHFTQPSSTIPLLVNFLALTYILLESEATFIKLRKREDVQKWKKYSVYGCLAIFILIAGYLSHAVLAVPANNQAKSNIYTVNGIMVGAEDGYIIVDNEAVPDVMPAMRMTYTIAPSAAAGMKNINTGDNVTLTLNIDINNFIFNLINISKR